MNYSYVFSATHKPPSPSLFLSTGIFSDVSIYSKTTEEGKVRQVFEEGEKGSEGEEPKGEQEPPLTIY